MPDSPGSGLSESGQNRRLSSAKDVAVASSPGRDIRVGDLEVVTVTPESPSGRPPVLFIHGTGCGAWVWDDWLEVFAERGYPSHALSLRGHGGSAGTYKDAAVRDYLDDLLAVLSTFGSRPVLIGHSLGARMAQIVLRETQHPAAVFLAPTPVDGMPRRPAVAQFLRHPLAAARSMATRDMEPLFRAAGRVFFSPTVSDTVLESFESQICGEPLDIFMREITQPVDSSPFSTPTLLAAATHDRLPLALWQRDAEALGSDFVELRDVGHNLMVDTGWRAAAETVLGWLDEVLEPSDRAPDGDRPLRARTPRSGG